MKKTKWILAALAAACAIGLVMGCSNGSDDSDEPTYVAVESVTLSETTLALTRGETGKLTAKVTPENADNKTVTWTSSDETIAIVSADGTVAAVAEGTATLTAKAGGKEAKCEITVSESAPVPAEPAEPAEHIHFYREGACTVCGFAKPSMEGGTIDDDGALVKYNGNAEKAVIPEGVRKIAGGAFSWCASLTSVEIPDSVTSIGDYAFFECESLESVEIPASVTSIGDYAFYGCKSLKTVTYKGTLAQWCAIDNDWCLLSNAKRITMSDVPDLKALKTLKIPAGVTKIGSSAFYECSSLTEVKYDGTLAEWCAVDGLYELMSKASTVIVTEDGEDKDLKSMTELVIPDGVTYVKGGAFYGCGRLESLTISGDVERIGVSSDSYGYGAFEGCTSLKSVTIGTSVTRIDDYVFCNCKSLETITYEGTSTQWNGITKGDDWAYGAGDFTIHCKGDESPTE